MDQGGDSDQRASLGKRAPPHQGPPEDSHPQSCPIHEAGNRAANPCVPWWLLQQLLSLHSWHPGQAPRGRGPLQVTEKAPGQRLRTERHRQVTAGSVPTCPQTRPGKKLTWIC